MIIYAGVSSYIGNLRGVFDPKGIMVGHVADLSATHGKIGTPAYTAATQVCSCPLIAMSTLNSELQVFHTDDGDLVGLLTVQTGAEGGLSKISSFWNVYNHLAKSRPDLIGTLSQPWPYDGCVR